MPAIIPGLLLGLRADGHRPRVRQAAQLPEVPALEPEGSAHGDGGGDSGADDAGDHHRRQDLRLVHRHRVGGDRRPVRRRAVDLHLPRDGRAGNCTARCSTPASWRRSRCSAWAPRARSAGCSRTTRFRRRCWRASAAWGMGITATGFFIAFCFLVVGCFLDAIPAIIIVGTILEPLARSVHMDPVHFAMIGIVSLAFGLVTPPYGLCLMISCAIAKVRMMLRAEGRHDHADADAGRAGADDHVPGAHPVPAEADLAGVPEVGLLLNDDRLPDREAAIAMRSKAVPDHSITLSACRSTDCGIAMPICLAVCRLTTSSNFVGCSTGRYAGFAPFRILST